jgi:hypothetical protein
VDLVEDAVAAVAAEYVAVAASVAEIEEVAEGAGSGSAAVGRLPPVVPGVETEVEADSTAACCSPGEEPDLVAVEE